MVPTFGRRTIRRFGHNMSAMKKLAARDFEDILQVRTHLLCRLLELTSYIVLYPLLSRSASH